MAAVVNGTFIDPATCTLATCDLEWATVDYFPNLGGNAFFLAVFSLLLVVQTGMGIYYRTWGYLVGLFGGLALEVIGYVARVQMHFNPWLSNPFLMYIICLTIGPVFLSAAIYICFTRLILVFGAEHARLSPTTYTKLFIASDILSLVLQAAGGAIADTANTSDLTWVGIHIMVAGLAFQVFSLCVFMVLAIDFTLRVYKSKSQPRGFRSSTSLLHVFVILLVVATLAIFIRSCYRVAELESGFGGKLANEEVPFMILEGTMMVIASVSLTVVHPGMIFGENWKTLGAVNNIFSKQKPIVLEKNDTGSPA